MMMAGLGRMNKTNVLPVLRVGTVKPGALPLVFALLSTLSLLSSSWKDTTRIYNLVHHTSST